MYLAELRDRKSVKNKAEVAFDAEYDVVVAGLGTAGALAALSAAENGASVLGVEKLNLCGGSATAGGVFGYYYGVAGGRFEKVDERSAEIQKGNFINGWTFNPETKAIALDEQLSGAGVELCYCATVIGVYLDDNNAPRGVRLVTPEGLRNVGCKVILDASGEGEVCAMAGAGYVEGRGLDGQSQPFSSVRVFADGDKMNMANFDAGYAISSDGADMSRAVINSASLHLVPEGETMTELLWIATIPGIREGRLIECEKTLTFKNYLDGERPENPVAYCFSNFDSHSQDWAFEEDLAQDWMMAASLWGTNVSFPVPLECMIVKGFSNIMAVGRCLSVDHMMACALRMQRGMQKLGQAAGTVAAIAASRGVDIREVKREEYIAQLEAAGCLTIPEEERAVLENAEDLKDALASAAPGEAIWHGSRNIDKYGNDLIAWLADDNANLSRNSALALGTAGRKEALPVLLEIVKSRDAFIPANLRRNQPRILGAVYLLGKLGEADSISVLLDYIKSASGVQEVSHAMMSLLRLGRKNETRREEIAQVLSAVVNASAEYNLLLKSSSKSGEEVSEPMADLMRLIIARELKAWGCEYDISDLRAKRLSWRERRMLEEVA
ncbi:MAG: FAD-dependent oxidoreductase [Planctomycetes bacterium]|nr:FAD-dependent oxidoreductase [Planctomycetota bacterium]